MATITKRPESGVNGWRPQWPLTAPVVLALSLGACARVHPANICASVDTQRAALSLLIDNAEQALPSLAGGVDSNDRDVMKNQLESMRHETGLFTFEFSTLEGFDKTTNKTTCSGKVKFTLAPSDQTKPALDQLHTVIGAQSLIGVSAPADLGGGSTESTLSYTQQPTASEDGTIVGIDHASDLVSSLIALALARTVVRADAAANAAEAATAASATTAASSPAVQTAEPTAQRSVLPHSTIPNGPDDNQPDDADQPTVAQQRPAPQRPMGDIYRGIIASERR